MVPITVQTLIMSSAPSPSIIVLKPTEDLHQEGKSRIVPIWIGAAEATQVGAALERTKFLRPMTHDLFLDALTNLDASIDHVLISNVKGSTFFARLALRQGARLIDLDARPSDAIALAVRQGAPLYIDEGVLERASFPCIVKEPFDDPSSKQELEEFHRFLEHVSPEDFDD